MSLLSDLLKPGFTALGNITGDPFKFEGQDGYFGTFSAELLEYVMEDAGQREAVRRSIVALKSQFITKPDAALGPEIEFCGEIYILAGIAEDGVHYVLTLEKRT